MTNQQKEQIDQAINGYCRVKGITKGELAVKAGVSQRIIIAMAEGYGAAIDTKIYKRVWQIVNPETMEGIFQTADCKSVFDLCNSAVKNKFMAGLTGDTGCGKTTALQAYSVRPNVFYYYIDATVTPLVFLSGLLREMGVNFSGTPNQMRDRVCDELNTLEGALLIIDEAGKLKDKMVLLLHSIRDKTLRNAAIVLAGMPYFKNNMIKKVNSGVTGYSEFYRRVNLWHELGGLTVKEIEFVLTENGITDKEAQREFRKLNRFGDLMNAINLHKTVNS